MRKIPVTVAVLGATALMALGAAGPAAAGGSREAQIQASPCWWNGDRFWCNNRSGAPVFSDIHGSRIVGYMYTNPSWFGCRSEGDPTGGGGPHPNRWVITTADNGAAGVMKDSDIISETDSLPACGIS
ncbi:hypothetical protein [Streptomyces celluloflavus]|uniref:hypothetical protein n=1 Tax=Streptomyces celluloflavus TaxID=58344 RepID=UPI00366459CE